MIRLREALQWIAGKMVKGICRPLIVICLAAGPYGWSVCLAESAPDREMWDRAVRLGRDGQFEQSLQLLQRLRSTAHNNQDLIGDQVVILLWAGRPAEALAQAAELNLASSPDYVLESVARAARDLKRFDQAAEYYQLGAGRFPDRWQFRLGWLLSLAEAGQLDRALEIYQALFAAQPDNIEVLLGGGYLFRLRREFLSALDCYERVLALAANHDEAYRLRVLSLSELGAAQLALRDAERRPELFRDSDWQRLRGDYSAAAVRWGELPAMNPETRFVGTDHSIDRLDQDLAYFSEEAVDARRRAHYDRLIALRDRSLMDEVLADYAELQKAGRELPPYALNAVADAYLYLEQPEKAVELYHQVLAVWPDDLNSQIGLFYAYIESENFERAYELIDRVAAAQPVWRKAAGGQGPQRPNWRKLDVDMIAALARSFGNQLQQAQERLEPLVDQAPLKADLRAELAAIYQQRGWSERALAEYNRARSINRESLQLELGHIAALLDLDRPEQVADRIDSLLQLYPENKQVQRLVRDWAFYNGWSLRTEALYGKSDGATFGSRDWFWDTVLSGPSVQWHYRPFLHALYSRATFPEGSAKYERLGLGVQYTHDRWRWRTEFSAERTTADDSGVEFEWTWQPDDYWRFGARLATFSTDVPLRAYSQGVDGQAYRLTAGYQSNESRALDGSLDYLDMSDGNQRWSARLAWKERLVSQPHYLLNGLFEMYGSRNSQDNVVYFNPERDAAATATLINDWIGYRHYDQRLTHRLLVQGGLYWQENFGSDWTAAVRYEQDWNLDAATVLRYGVGWASNVYDSDREERLHTYVTFEWRF